MATTSPPNQAQARPNPLRWTLAALGAVLLAFGLFGANLTHVARWIAALGGITIILVAPAAVRSMVTSVELTEEGVTGAGFLGPVHIPWTEVVRVCDDARGIMVQSTNRSARIDLSTVTVSFQSGGRRIANFENTDEMVRYILAHVPKSSLLEMSYWMPT